MNYQLINKVCYVMAMSSIIVGAGIGLAAIWLEGILPLCVVSRSFATTALLFVASALGALVTRLLVVRAN